MPNPIEYFAYKDMPPFTIAQCKRCGAIINDVDIHTEWHKKLAELLSRASTDSFLAYFTSESAENDI